MRIRAYSCIADPASAKRLMTTCMSKRALPGATDLRTCATETLLPYSGRRGRAVVIGPAESTRVCYTRLVPTLLVPMLLNETQLSQPVSAERLPSSPGLSSTRLNRT